MEKITDAYIVLCSPCIEEQMTKLTWTFHQILFVRNLMLSTTENTLRDLFNRLGKNEVRTFTEEWPGSYSHTLQVERVKKAKDYAFVHFSTREAAERALASSKGLVIDGAEVGWSLGLLGVYPCDHSSNLKRTLADLYPPQQVEVVWSKPVDKQTYNTRKTLTKAFTSGISSELVSRDGALLRGISPRRRGEHLILLSLLLFLHPIAVSTCSSAGAAGIRGLGAPGTAPPKQLVQR